MAYQDSLPQHIRSGYTDIKVAVLGASGFIGRWVVRQLSLCGAEVFAVARDVDATRQLLDQYGANAKIVQANLIQSESLENLYASVKPTITFNLAGYGIDRSERDEILAYQINADLLVRLCDIIAKYRDPDWQGQDLVHVGSALEYGEVGGDLAEDTETNPTTLYGQSKLKGTQALSRCVVDGKLKGVTARLFTVYGPGEHPGRLVPSLFEAAQNQESLALTAGLQKRDFTYVKDVVEGMLRLGLCSSLPDSVLNLATGKLITVREFTETTASQLGIAPFRLDFGAIPTRVEEMEHLPVSITRLKQVLDWQPSITVEQGINDIAAFVSP